MTGDIPDSMARRERSSAWPLAWIWICLIVYASWHPFVGWRWVPQTDGRSLVDLLWLPPPIHSSPFDLWSNLAGYVPLGGLLCMARLRDLTGDARRDRLTPWLTVLWATAIGVGLSLVMEWGQYVLPKRVPSRVDWGLNSAGALIGALLSLAADRSGWVARWERLRHQWFVPHGPLGVSLLVSWPIALLFPPPLPLGLGQVLGRLTDLLQLAVQDTPWATGLAAWIPHPIAPEGQLSPGGDMLVITLGALAPALVAYCMARQVHHRLVLLIGSLVFGGLASTLSTALNFSPEHSLTWITPPVVPALLLAAVLGFGLAWMPRRGVAAVGLLCVGLLIWLVNQAGTDPYFALSLQAWEQGRFVRFHGLSQWLGWLWPFVALVFLAIRLMARTPNSPPDTPQPTGLSTIGP